MNDYKIAFFDVDGTLAAHNQGAETSILERVPQTAKMAINKLEENGITPVIATGRNRGMIKELMDALHIRDLIANNGRFVEYQGEVVMHQSFADEQVRQIVEHLQNEQIEFCYETADILYQNQSSTFQPDSSMEIKRIADDQIPEHVIQMIFRTNDPQSNIQLQIPGIQAVKVAPTVYDVTYSDSNKAIGIREYLKVSHIKLENTIAFGDEINDWEMFDKAGFSVAMGNANPLIKQQADFVTRSVDQDGILFALNQLGLIK